MTSKNLFLLVFIGLWLRHPSTGPIERHPSSGSIRAAPFERARAQRASDHWPELFQYILLPGLYLFGKLSKQPNERLRVDDDQKSHQVYYKFLKSN